ncbi:MAG TPA: hypothetical protein VF505_15165, partial [Thermoanaerobaculia bacterium]
LIGGSLQSGDRQKLDGVITRLTSAADSSRWVDPLHPTADSGQQVFDDIKDAVVKLTDLLGSNRSSLDGATLQAAIDLLMKACRGVASASLDEAVRNGGDARAIARARTDLATGDADVSARRYSNAVLDYRNCLKDLH